MNIKIDTAVLQAAIDENVTKALQGALSSFSVQGALAKTISGEALTSTMIHALDSAISKLDHQALIDRLATELETAIAASVAAILREGVVSTVARIRGLPEYGAESQQARAALTTELFGPQESKQCAA